MCVLSLVAVVAGSVDDVSGFPFALSAPSLSPLFEGESAAWASVVGVAVGPGGDEAGEALVWASVVWCFVVGHVSSCSWCRGSLHCAIGSVAVGAESLCGLAAWERSTCGA